MKANSEPESLEALMAGWKAKFADPAFLAEQAARVERMSAVDTVLDRARVAADERTRAQRLSDAGVPKRIQLALPEELEETPTTRAVDEFRAKYEKGVCFLVLLGGVGVGKTTAAAAECLRRKSPLFLPAAKLLTTSMYSKDEMSAIDRADLLVIDDLGAEYSDSKGHLAALVDAIIDARYRDLGPTIITSNLTAEQFKARIGERATDRIRQAGLVKVFNEPSRRARRGEGAKE